MSVKEAKEKAMYWCSRKEYCRKDMFEKAVLWGCTPVEANELVDFLVEQKFVDERRYTEAFVKDKLRFNKWGRVKMTYMLRTHNIDKEIVTDAMSEINDTEYLQILIGELQKKYKTIRQGTTKLSTKLNVFEIKGKLFRFATSRGFESEMIDKAISKINDLQ